MMSADQIVRQGVGIGQTCHGGYFVSPQPRIARLTEREQFMPRLLHGEV